MFCKKCGSQLPDDANFCMKCGAEVMHSSENKTVPVTETPIRGDSPATPMNTSDIAQHSNPEDNLQNQHIDETKEVEPTTDRTKNIMYLFIIFFILIVGGLFLKNVVNPAISQEVTTKMQQKADAETAAKEKAREKERKLAEDAEKYREAHKPPVTLSELVIEPNIIGQPTARLVLLNNSDKTIDAYTVRIYAYDNYGKTVSQFGIPDKDYFSGISQREIPPGMSSESNHVWTLHGFDNGRTFKACLMSIHFADGSEWETLQPLDVSIETKFNPE